MEEQTMQFSKKTALQEVEEATSAKALRQGHVWLLGVQQGGQCGLAREAKTRRQMNVVEEVGRGQILQGFVDHDWDLKFFSTLTKSHWKM